VVVFLSEVLFEVFTFLRYSAINFTSTVNVFYTIGELLMGNNKAKSSA